MSEWLSKAAVSWALWRAPDVPDRLVSTLIAYAAYADENGRGAYPSHETVAGMTRKSPRQARRDTAELVKLGLLLPGDWRLVSHVRGDRRPNVYDLAMPRRDTADEGSPVSPRRRSRGDTQGQTGGHTGSHGGSPVTTEKFLRTSRTGGRVSHARADASAGATATAAPAAKNTTTPTGASRRRSTPKRMRPDPVELEAASAQARQAIADAINRHQWKTRRFSAHGLRFVTETADQAAALIVDYTIACIDDGGEPWTVGELLGDTIIEDYEDFESVLTQAARWHDEGRTEL